MTGVTFLLPGNFSGKKEFNTNIVISKKTLKNSSAELNKNNVKKETIATHRKMRHAWDGAPINRR